MEFLGIYPETIWQFEKHNLVSASEPPLGALVYMVVRAYYKGLGKLDSYLFVGDYREDWDCNSQELTSGAAFVF